MRGRLGLLIVLSLIAPCPLTATEKAFPPVDAAQSTEPTGSTNEFGDSSPVLEVLKRTGPADLLPSADSLLPSERSEPTSFESVFAAPPAQILPDTVAGTPRGPPPRDESSTRSSTVQAPLTRTGVGQFKPEVEGEPWLESSLSPPSPERRYSTWGRGYIVIEDPLEYPRIKALDVEDPGSLFETYRANLLGQNVPDEWDFFNIINTDRPDFTDATYTVGTGVSTLETGYTYARTRSPDSIEINHSGPEALFRYGLTNELEIRFRWNGYLGSQQHDLGSDLRLSTEGTDDIDLGFKYEVVQQKGWLPVIAVVSGSSVPAGVGEVSANAMQPYVRVVYGWALRRWLYIKAGSGVDFYHTRSVDLIFAGAGGDVLTAQSNDNITEFHQSVSFLYQISQRLGGYSEWFVLYNRNGVDTLPQHYFNTGLCVYITPDVQLDVRIGKLLSDRVNSIFTGGGVSIRF